MENKKISAMSLIKQAICYLAGLFIIATGINFSKMTGLGISAVSSIPRACQLIWDFTLGTTTFVVYGVLIVLQMLLLVLCTVKRKEKFTSKSLLPLAKAMLGFPLTFVFSFMVDLSGIDEKAVGHMLLNFPRPEGYIMELLYLIAAVILISIGIFLYLRPHWMVLPAEGLSSALAEFTGLSFGNCKTIVDSSMVVGALVLQLVFLGGFSSFTGANVVVREGTVIAAVAVGQVIKLLTKLIGKPTEAFLGIKPKQN